MKSDDRDQIIRVASYLTDTALTASPDDNSGITVDWDVPLYDVTEVPDGEYRWVTAIQKVPPKSGSFWYDYGKRYNEQVIMKIVADRDLYGKRCCDVMVETRRTVGDVVLSAWNEYNQQMISAPNK